MPRFIIPPPLPPLISPGATSLATVIFTVLAAGAVYSPPSHSDSGKAADAGEHVRYLLPLLPPHVPVKSTRVDWIPDLSHVGGVVVASIGAREGKGPRDFDDGGGTRVRPVPQLTVQTPVFSDSELVGGTVYIESQTDEPVERDPGSAAPVYPSFLQDKRIEGAVTVSYVVDTSGFADSASLKVTKASHVAFADAVRAALPGMHFRPAQIAGRPVRQLVIQEFRFVIRQPADTLHRPIARVSAPETPDRDSGDQ
jgi:hypothetical protein